MSYDIWKTTEPDDRYCDQVRSRTRQLCPWCQADSEAQEPHNRFCAIGRRERGMVSPTRPDPLRGDGAHEANHSGGIIPGRNGRHRSET